MRCLLDDESTHHQFVQIDRNFDEDSMITDFSPFDYQDSQPQFTQTSILSGSPETSFTQQSSDFHLQHPSKIQKIQVNLIFIIQFKIFQDQSINIFNSNQVNYPNSEQNQENNVIVYFLSAYFFRLKKIILNRQSITLNLNVQFC